MMIVCNMGPGHDPACVWPHRSEAEARGELERWDGLGVPGAMLEPGMAVMVPVGMVQAVVNGGPTVVAYATVMHRASREETAVLVDPVEVWWLDVHMGPGVTLPQMYRADQILGVPAYGLAMVAFQREVPATAPPALGPPREVWTPADGYRKVCWYGESGRFYKLDEDPAPHEPDGFSPVWMAADRAPTPSVLGPDRSGGGLRGLASSPWVRDRLEAAEKVCQLAGIVGQSNSERGKALTEAWMAWHRQYGDHAPHISDDEIARLAAMREAASAVSRGRIGPAVEHPEALCRRCGGPNVRGWCAPSPLWNAVMRGGSVNGDELHGGIVCPVCFAALAEEQGVARTWRLAAEQVLVPLEMVTPSGRVWNGQTWLWEEPGAGSPLTERDGGSQ